MIALAFFSWWYGPGWKQVASGFGRRIRKTSHVFSISLLLKTLFAPWRRIISYPGAGLSERFRAWGDNLVSRCVGFVVRLFVLLAALLSIVAVVLFNVIELIAWPLLPLAVPVCLVLGIIG